ncbi:GtrA-like protein [Azospirillum palustre]
MVHSREAAFGLRPDALGPGALGAAPSKSREAILFAGAVSLLVLALWSIPRLSFGDGGVHVAMAHLLTVLAADTADPILSQYFMLNLHSEPNWFIYPILAALLQVFDPYTAEKILLTGYVIGLPYAFRYAVTAVNPRNAPLSWYALPFVFSWPLNLGLYNFIFSLVWLFVALGYALHHWTTMTPRRTLAMTLLGLVTYFSHLTAAVVLCLSLGGFGMWVLWSERRHPGSSGLRTSGKPEANRLWVPFAAFAAAILPIVALTLLFILRNTGQKVEFGPDLWYRTKMLVYGNVILSHTRWEGAFALPVALLPFATAALFLFRRRQGRMAAQNGALNGMLAGALLVLLFSYAIPNSTSGGGLAVQRIQIFPYLLLMLWLAVATDWSALRRATVAVAGTATAGLLAINMVHNHQNSRYLAEFDSVAQQLEPGRTMLLLDFTGWKASPDGLQDSFRLNFVGHPQSRFVASRPLADLNIYQASTPNFPVRYRPDADPYIHLRGNGANPETPPTDEFLMAGTRSTIRVDYVLVWGLTPQRAGMDGARLTLDQLDAGYELAGVSEHGGMRIYRRKD